jgi:hypothetical protein
MTPIQPLLIVAACTLALAACASAPPAYETSAPPPADTTGLGQNAATGGSTYGAANTGGTYPYGTIHRVEVVVMGPDGTVWVQSGADAARHQDDLDSCYFDAQGQVAFTSYSNRASRATFRSKAGGLRLAALDGRMNDFDSCMVAKGYHPK